MAKVYCTPEDIKEPDFEDFYTDDGCDWKAYNAAVEQHKIKIADWCRTNSPETDDLIGEIVSWGVADGKAHYLVYQTKPLSHSS